MNDFSNICILIPSLNPDENLTKLVDELCQYKWKKITIIDDGSSNETKKIFDNISKVFKVTVISHDNNQGKGAALKAGFKNIKLHEKQIQYLKRVIEFFISEYELIGINGIDFIISKDIYFLEINPRITQTCFLYNNSFEHGFVKAHIDAFLNKNLPSIKSTSNTTAAFETLFSNTKFIFNYSLLEYNFISNIPVVNTSINIGDPICTINITSDDEKKVNKLLSDNISLIKNKLTNVEII